MSPDRRSQDRRSDDPRIHTLVEKVAGIELRQVDISERLEVNTQITAEISRNTADIVEVWQSVKGGMRVLGWLGLAAKWLAIVAGCVTAVSAAVYALLHFGGPK